MKLTKSTPIGWIGTGVMGLSMCQRLMNEGYKNITVFNRTKAKAQPLLNLEATWADNPAEVARHTDIIFTIVGYPNDVESVYFGKNGILTSARPGSIVVDMTTTRPSLAERIYQVAQSKQVSTIDAPVSGGDVGAKNGTLSIMIGGDKKPVEAIRPLLDIMGKNLIHEGSAGTGQHTKMCNQITIAGTMIGVCESLLYAHKAGLDAPTMLQAISGGAAGCWTLDQMAPRILQRDFEPGFYVEHFIKDMEIALDEARRMNLALPGLALVHQLYKAVAAQGYARKGTQALTLALEQLSGVKST